MNDLKVGEYDVLAFLKPDTLLGALVYLVVFLSVAVTSTTPPSVSCSSSALR
jgi:hypothetical protein